MAEQVYKVGGLYTQAIEKIVYWLEKALPYAETPEQQESLEMLIDYYKTGNLVAWDVYNVAWVKDLNSLVDNVNGFIEIYGDPLARKATWEAVVNFKNLEATKRTKIISDNAQLFEICRPSTPGLKERGEGSFGQSDHRSTVGRRLRSDYPHRDKPSQCQLDPQRSWFEIGDDG